MPRLSSGLVFSAGYAFKLRKALFAQMGSYIKKDKEWSGKVAYSSALLNRALYTLLVDDLKLEKTDVVRITIDYEIDETSKAINWRWDTLKVEIYKRIPPETYSDKIKNFIPKAPELALGVFKYSVAKIGETFDGDYVYSVKVDEKEIGSCILIQIDENTILLKKAAVLEPTPAIFEKVKIPLEGRTIEDTIAEKLGEVIRIGKHVSHDEALNLVNAIRNRVEAKPIEKPPEIEIIGEET